MSKQWKAGRETVPMLDPGWYPARLLYTSTEDSQFGESLVLHFRVEAGEDQISRALRVYSSNSLFPGNKYVKPSTFYLATSALLKKEINEGEVIKDDDLVGKFCSVKVELKKSAKGNIYQKITEFKPLMAEHASFEEKVKKSGGEADFA